MFIAYIGDEARRHSFALARRLRDAGVSVVVDLEGRKLKKALAVANNLGARYSLIVGDDEMQQRRLHAARYDERRAATPGRIGIDRYFKAIERGTLNDESGSTVSAIHRLRIRVHSLIINTMLDNLGTLKRTHYAATSARARRRKGNLMGWVHRRRDFGPLTFIDLRDREGIVQVVFDEDKNAEAHAAPKSCEANM